ncbi:hypothetical protein ACR3K2_05010 [Cryptosporidium serpentis]
MSETGHILRPRSEGDTLKVAEAVLRRRRIPESNRMSRFREEKRKLKKELHKSPIKSLKAILKSSRDNILDKRRLKNMNKKPLLTPKTNDGKNLLIVVRNSRRCGSIKSFKILKNMGLVSKFSAIILSHSQESLKLIQSVKPFVFYGFPTLQLLKNLIYTKGAFKSDEKFGNNKILLTDNLLVEDKLGEIGILCTEDIVMCLWNGREQDEKSFDEVLQNMAPFQLCDLKKAEGIDARKFEMGFLGKSVTKKIQSIL